MNEKILTSTCVLCVKLCVNILSLFSSLGPVTPKLGSSTGPATLRVVRQSINSGAQFGVTITVSSLTFSCIYDIRLKFHKKYIRFHIPLYKWYKILFF